MYTQEDYQREYDYYKPALLREADRLDQEFSHRNDVHAERVKEFGAATPEERVYMNADLTYLQFPWTNEAPVFRIASANPYFLHCKDPSNGVYYYISELVTWSNILRYTEARASLLRYSWEERNKIYVGGSITAISAESNSDNTSQQLKKKRFGYIANIANSLLEEQDLVMRVNPQSRIVISWPAWSGKTNALLHRMDYLVHEEDIQPGGIALFCYNVALKKYLTESVKWILRSVPPIYSVDKWSLDVLNELSNKRFKIDYKKVVAVEWDSLDRFLERKYSTDWFLEALIEMVERFADVSCLRQGWKNDAKSAFELLVSVGCWKIEAFIRLRTSMIDEILRSRNLPLHDEESTTEKTEYRQAFNKAFKKLLFTDWYFRNLAIGKNSRVKLDKLSEVKFDFIALWQDYCYWAGIPYLAEDLNAKEVHFALIYLGKQILTQSIGKEFLRFTKSKKGQLKLPLMLQEYQHIMIDEFQDLEKFQLSTIACFTDWGISLAGDITQSIFVHPTRGDFDFGFGIDRFCRLEVTHRSTIETIRFANSIIWSNNNYSVTENAVSSWEKPMVFRVSDISSFLSFLKTELVKFPDSSFLIACPNKASCDTYNNLFHDFWLSSYVGDKDAWDFSRHLHIATYYQIKWLEFDFVYVMDLPEFLNNSHITNKENVLYTTFTRPKLRLFLVVNETSSLTFLSKTDPTLYKQVSS